MRPPEALAVEPHTHSPETSGHPPSPKQRRSGLRRAVVVGLVALVALVAGVAAGLLLSSDDPDSSDSGSEMPVATSRDASATIPVDGGATVIEAALGSLWVLDDKARGELLSYDESSDDLTASTAVGSYPDTMGVGAGAVWVSSGGKVLRIDPDSVLVTDRVTTGADIPTSIVIDSDQVFEVDYDNFDVDPEQTQVVRINPATLQVEGDPVKIADCPDNAAAGDGAIYITHSACIKAVGVSRLDTGSSALQFVDQDLDGYTFPALGGGVLWVSNPTDGTVLPLDPTTLELDGDPIFVGQSPQAMVADDDSLWIALRGEDAVARLDLDQRKVVERIAVGDKPSLITEDAGHVWVYNDGDETISKFDP